MNFKNGQLFLAPMAGITETVFRGICKRNGADVVISEMASAEGIFHNAKNTSGLLEFAAQQRPFGIQLFGANAEHLAYAAAYVEEHFRPDFIDLNSGCPVSKVVKKNGGCALMRNAPLFKNIITRMAKAVSTPITVKIRSGWTLDELVDVEFAKIAEESGAAAIILHPRTRSMGFSGHSLWDRIALVKFKSSVPVIGSGDVCSPKDAANMFAQTGCDSIMIGRAVLGNPWIFSQVKDYFSKGSFLPVSPAERLSTTLEHIRGYVSQHGEKRAIGELKKHIGWYIKGFPGAADLRGKVNRANTIQELEEAVNTVFGSQ
jgi:tRNA-dihydrouridine synthase B